tara:strand:- start:2103 stop:2591 length:489 start_codon:yes stop_codon:yes gene_type:complete
MKHIMIDNFLEDPNKYVIDVLKNEFEDVKAGDTIFKGIQVRTIDELQYKVEDAFPDYEVTFNFIRQSPLNQKEPNYIHTDEMMGDKTVLLYLNKHHPMEDGTTLYKFNRVADDYLPMCTFYAQYNRLVIFDSSIPHSRNMYENFGEGEYARLVQVMFLKEKQ